MRMHQERSYVLGLENALNPEGMYLGIDRKTHGLSEVLHHLLFGGGGHRTGENRAGGKYELLEKKKQKSSFREAGCGIIGQHRTVCLWTRFPTLAGSLRIHLTGMLPQDMENGE